MCASQPNDKKIYYLQDFKRGLGISIILEYINYLTHLVEDPTTKINQFLIFPKKQILKAANERSEPLIENFRNQVVTSAYQYKRVLQVARDKSWMPTKICQELKEIGKC